MSSNFNKILVFVPGDGVAPSVYAGLLSSFRGIMGDENVSLWSHEGLSTHEEMMDGLLEYLRRLTDKFSKKDIVFVSHSRGAYLSLRCLSVIEDLPIVNRIKGMVLMNPLLPKDWAVPVPSLDVILSVVAQSFRSTYTMPEKVFRKRFFNESTLSDNQVTAIVDQSTSIPKALLALPAPLLLSASTSCPMLVIGTESDKVFSDTYIQKGLTAMRALWPDQAIESQTFSGTHFGCLETPDTFAQSVEGFLKTLK
ncbi:alpha/beta hydrolase [bacterium]|jgi:pimeloyl-ACP methyl ester carboxylesterase|nr:alpha/beta hydrolase [bacterium]